MICQGIRHVCCLSPLLDVLSQGGRLTKCLHQEG